MNQDHNLSEGFLLLGSRIGIDTQCHFAVSKAKF